VVSFRELVREYERELIGPVVLGEVRRVCSLRARRYPPAVYARSQVWDEQSMDDLVQDVVVDRLLGERQIDYLFDVARTVDAWRALLDRQVRVVLARRRVRTVVDNLLDRARRMLGGWGSVVRSTALGHVVYSFSGSGAQYEPLDDRRVRQVGELVRVVRRRLPGRGDRAPVVYGGRELEAVLGCVLDAVPGGVSVRDLGRVFGFVLTDWVPAVLEHDEGTAAAAPAVVMDPSEVVVIRTTAAELLAGMSGEEMTIVRGRLAGLPDADVAREVGLSRPTLIKRRRVLLDRLRQAAEGLSEAGREALVDEVSLLVMGEGRFQIGST